MLKKALKSRLQETRSFPRDEPRNSQRGFLGFKLFFTLLWKFFAPRKIIPHQTLLHPSMEIPDCGKMCRLHQRSVCTLYFLSSLLLRKPCPLTLRRSSLRSSRVYTQSLQKNHIWQFFSTLPQTTTNL